MKSISNLSLFTIGATVMSAALAIGPAHAGDDARDMSRAIKGSLTEAQVLEAVATAGYVDVYKIKSKGHAIEVKAFDANGDKTEIYMDPVTGDVLRAKVESDDQDDDYRDSDKECG